LKSLNLNNMNSRERIYKTINKEKTDRIPAAFWSHFPFEDETSDGLANAIINFQNKYDFDLIKITPISGYFAEAYGAKFIKLNSKIDKGSRECISFPIKKYTDWEKISEINVDSHILERELEVIRIVRKRLGNEILIVQTVPNPLTLAKDLRSDNLWLDDIKNHPREIMNGLESITKNILKFCLASVDAGADGIFLFTQVASFDLFTEEEYKKFGMKYDLNILEKLKESLLILHIHGLNIMFDLLKDYPVDIFNWHDRLTQPNLREARKKCKGAFIGGLDEDNVLLNGNIVDVKNQVKNAIEQTEGEQIIIGPGCVLPIDTPEENIFAVKEALVL